MADLRGIFWNIISRSVSYVVYIFLLNKVRASCNNFVFKRVVADIIDLLSEIETLLL